MQGKIIHSDPHLEKVKHFHDQDAQHYTEMRYHSNSCEGIAYITRRELVLSLVKSNAMRVLDIGCGPGILTADLLKMGKEVYSTDLSSEMIKQAKQKANNDFIEKKAYFSVSDASHLPLAADQMDIALCIGVICYIRDYKSVLSEIRRVLKSNGEAIVQINNTTWPGLYEKLVPMYHWIKSKVTGKKYDGIDFDFNYFDFRTFCKDVKKTGFRIEDLKYFDFRFPFIDVLFPKFSVKIGKAMYKNRHLSFMKYFAFGVLLKMTRI